MQLNNKQRRQNRRRNFLAKELHEPRYGPRIVEEKRKHKLDEIHEQEAEEELLSYENPDEMEFYWEDHPIDENGEEI